MVITNNYDSLNYPLFVDHLNYNNALTQINSKMLPSLPMKLSLNRQQEIRQYTRLIYSMMYNVDSKSDVIIYLVLTDMLRMVLSDVSIKSTTLS